MFINYRVIANVRSPVCPVECGPRQGIWQSKFGHIIHLSK